MSNYNYDYGNIFKSTASGALTGASFGAAAGGITAVPGAIIGGTIGLGTSLIGEVNKAKAHDELEQQNRDMFERTLKNNAESISEFVNPASTYLSYALGGMPNDNLPNGEIVGADHEQGGVQIGSSNVEGGEVIINDIVFSKRLTLPTGETFADKASELLSKKDKIVRKYKEIGDKYRSNSATHEIDALDSEITNLGKLQTATRQQVEGAQKETDNNIFAFGNDNPPYSYKGGYNPYVSREDNFPMLDFDVNNMELPEEQPQSEFIPISNTYINNKINSENLILPEEEEIYERIPGEKETIQTMSGIFPNSVDNSLDTSLNSNRLLEIKQNLQRDTLSTITNQPLTNTQGFNLTQNQKALGLNLIDDVGNIINNYRYRNVNIPYPNMVTPQTLDTNVDVSPEIGLINSEVASAKRDIIQNTSDSNIAIAKANDITGKKFNAINSLAGTRIKAEDSIKAMNAQILNNAESYNTSLVNKYNEDVYGKKIQNIDNSERIINNIGDDLNTYNVDNQKRDYETEQLKLYALRYPSSIDSATLGTLFDSFSESQLEQLYTKSNIDGYLTKAKASGNMDYYNKLLKYKTKKGY